MSHFLLDPLEQADLEWLSSLGLHTAQARLRTIEPARSTAQAAEEVKVANPPNIVVYFHL